MPAPPYYAVIFSSQRTEAHDGHDATGDRMVHRVAQIAGRQKWDSHFETRVARVEQRARGP